MSTKLLTACETPQNQSDRDRFKRIVEIFAPDVRFDPKERFFPVDLGSTVKASDLYRIDRAATPVTWPREKSKGQIQPPDLAAASSDHFTSVAALVTEKLKGTTGEKMLVPQVDEIHKLHTKRTIQSKLTIYATVCTAREVPNYYFLKSFPPQDAGVKLALGEGILLTYYMFFPAAESPTADPTYNAEGDWSGISLLFKRVPDPQKIAQNLPELSCYFKKSGPYYTAGSDGFAKWKNVTRTRDVQTAIDTHPVVYVSRGRHNCYYWPVSTSIPDSPWSPAPLAKKIEAGDYTPSPAGGTITGGWDPAFPTWVYAAFGPPALVFEFCAEMGCVEFDSSGLPANNTPTKDVAGKGGHIGQSPGGQTKPGSTQYPASPPTGSPPPLTITPVYVDLTNTQLKDWWAFEGHWGAARLRQYDWWGEDPSKKHTARHLNLGGPDRPLLSAWFMWNLYWNVPFGSGGATGYTTSGP